ncbi:transposase [Streptomyces sp. ISL-100]|uniref:transposase n=1 Tax=Streptomyces sp. ISL-100 TaxID=2819173 RepID=UPI001BEB119B|nr:transposase [Streptomyces sp. ISL-100]MBT2398247.1 transposase [Streptomyces sp. ISL-100]
MKARGGAGPTTARSASSPHNATTRSHALINPDLYLPKSWTEDRERCRAARIPDDRDFATRNDLARDMIPRALDSPLPIARVTADCPYGQDSRFQRFMEDAHRACGMRRR